MQALTIRNLTKTYKNGFQALRSIDLNVIEGDFFALLGPNGAGKTTLIGIVTSLVNKTSGKVLIFDKDIDTDFPLAKSYIGVVPQEFNFSIFERVEDILIQQAGYYGIEPTLARQRTEKYLKKLELWNQRHLPPRLLSGGMKRRMMIARALVHEPKMLILDEPTAGVDVEVRRLMWDLLREINRNGTTIILTTHYLEEAETLCKNIAIIDHGDIIENTNMGEMLLKLNIETFILYLKQPLITVPQLKHFNCRQLDAKTLEVELQSPRTVNELLAELSQQNIEIISMKNKVNRLEELFIKLTSNKHVKN